MYSMTDSPVYINSDRANSNTETVAYLSSGGESSSGKSSGTVDQTQSPDDSFSFI